MALALALVDLQLGSESAPYSLELREGQSGFVRCGPAGASTLILLAAGLLQPEAGSVSIFERDPVRMSRREIERLRHQLGTVLQPVGLVSNLSLRANLELPCAFSTTATCSDEVEHWLSQCAIVEWAQHRPGDVPRDVLKRAGIARGLVRRPKLLLMDDPADDLDDCMAQQMIDLCRATVPSMLVAGPRPLAGLDLLPSPQWTGG